MANKRITEITETTSLDSNSFLLVDSTTNGTNKVSPSNLPVSTATTSAIAASASTKVDKVTGKGLTKNELTDELLANLNNQSGVNTGDQGRNLIINGDMVIDQRNVGVSVTPTGSVYTLDRWLAGMNQASKYSVQQSTDAPPNFNNSLKVTSLSAYTLLSSDGFGILQSIEGFNSAKLCFGTSNAKTVTLSFWVKSSLTGSFGVSLRNADSTRSYPSTYIINNANTWEKKTITISGDITGTWVGATNGKGIVLSFGLGNGTSVQGTANTWQTGNYQSVTGTVNLLGTSGATWQITGVQLEQGSIATQFENRHFGHELMLCQRYFEKSYDISVAPGTALSYNGHLETSLLNAINLGDSGYSKYAVSKRAPATITMYSTITGAAGKIRDCTSSVDLSVSSVSSGTSGFRIDAVGGTTGHWTMRHWTADAEL